jgi:4-hydroxy-2-oxoheptanedioate aldolase
MAQINGWMSIPNAFANVTFARAGWDSVTLDMQHGLFELASIVPTLMALSAPQPRRLVRVPWNDAGVIGKVLDAGADGVIVPMVNSVEEASRVADACWYPPRGRRSFGPVLAASRAGGVPYLEAAKTIEVWAMIETREALEGVKNIAAVDGITGLYVGPNDLGLALGLPPRSDRDEPEMLQAFRDIVEAAAQSGRAAGIFCASPAYARRMIELGFSMVTVVSDAAVMGAGAAAACKAMKD